MIYNIFIFSLLFSLTCFAVQDIPKTGNKNNVKNDIDQKSFITRETTDLFTRRYGKSAIIRLLYIEKTILVLKEASLYKKLSTIDQLINRIHFMPDSKQWHKQNYWATPLEIIGTNYGDTEDIALLKYILMLKVGIHPKDIQLIQKQKPFKRRYKTYQENISLVYFRKDYVPLVLDYTYRGGKIYKYKDQFKFEFIVKSPNRIWNIITKEEVTNRDIDKLLNYIK